MIRLLDAGDDRADRRRRGHRAAASRSSRSSSRTRSTRARRRIEVAVDARRARRDRGARRRRGHRAAEICRWPLRAPRHEQTADGRRPGARRDARLPRRGAGAASRPSRGSRSSRAAPARRSVTPSTRSARWRRRPNPSPAPPGTRVDGARPLRQRAGRAASFCARRPPSSAGSRRFWRRWRSAIRRCASRSRTTAASVLAFVADADRSSSGSAHVFGTRGARLVDSTRRPARRHRRGARVRQRARATTGPTGACNPLRQRAALALDAAGRRVVGGATRRSR